MAVSSTDIHHPGGGHDVHAEPAEGRYGHHYRQDPRKLSQHQISKRLKIKGAEFVIQSTSFIWMI